jgi:hypothetical protein
MRESSFEAELRAYGALQSLLASAKEVDRLFKEAGLPVPPPVARLFGDSPANGAGHASTVPLPSPERPEGAASDWIWVEVSELNTTNLCLATLRMHGGGPMTATDVYERALRYNPKANRISIMNAGVRIDGESIRRSDEGWNLIDASKAPLIQGQYAWGPMGIFHNTEIAAYRRTIVRHIIKCSGGGLMVMQVVDRLRNQDQRFAVSKELISDDLERMQFNGQVKKIGNSRKWILTDAEP